MTFDRYWDELNTKRDKKQILMPIVIGIAIVVYLAIPLIGGNR